MRKIFSLLLAVLWVQQLWAQYNPDNPADPDVYYALTLEASPSAGGSVSPGSTLQVAEGMTVTCKAIANSGYRFVQWTQDGLLISTESTFDYVMPANDVKLIAVFEWEPDNPEDPDNEGYSHKIYLEASPAHGGYFENNTLLVVEGKTVKIKAYPHDGYRFSVWKKDGETVSMENPMTVVMGTEDVTYTATFEYAPNNPGDPDLKEPYAVLSEGNTVLTFYYDGKKDANGGMSVGPFSIPSYRGWANHVADITTVVFQPSFADCTTLTSTAFWFFECPNLTTINGIENLKTPQVTNMDSMFKGCSSLTSLDVTGFDMGNVTRIDGMFYGCSSLTSLDLHNFNTSKVTRLFDLFHDCSGLTSLDLRSFDTSGVTSMEQLFDGCSSLTSLDISTFNTSKVTNMHNLFDGCSSLTSLDVSHFITEEVTNMDAMFYNCKLLTGLDLHKFNTAKVTTMRSMFYNCEGLTSLDLSSFNTSEVTMMNFMFEGCSGLTSLDLHNFNTSKVMYTNDMFYGCANLLTLDISGFDMTNVTSLSGMFSHCSSLASIQLGNAKISGSVLDDIGNPNLLVYVNSADVAPSGIQNVVVNDVAEEIVLAFTWEGNGNFYCPKQFLAHKISYTHEFCMETEIGVSRGWETIALPFTVQSITHEKNGPLAPFGAEGGKPFWLGQMTEQGLVNAQQIVANVPYVISMPNNSVYPDSYNQAGAVTFSATDCVVPVTEQHAVSSGNRVLVPAFQRVEQSPDVYAINLYDAYGSYKEGSIFVANLREVRPFEAYTLHPNGSRQFFTIDELMADPTGIMEIEVMRNADHEKFYNLKGQRLTTPQQGVNIVNGRKVVIK